MPVRTLPVNSLLKNTSSSVIPVTVVLAGILPLPVTVMPNAILLVSLKINTFSVLALAALVLTCTLVKLTTTSCELVASYVSTKVLIFLLSLFLPIFTFSASPPISSVVTLSL